MKRKSGSINVHKEVTCKANRDLKLDQIFSDKYLLMTDGTQCILGIILRLQHLIHENIIRMWPSAKMTENLVLKYGHQATGIILDISLNASCNFEPGTQATNLRAFKSSFPDGLFLTSKL